MKEFPMISLNRTTALTLILLASCVGFNTACEMAKEAREKGFVYLHEVDPTIQVSLRYYGNENFLGRTVKGYKKPVLIMTRQAAQALKKVQQDVKKDGYSLLVYDAYRPQQAVDNFMSWSLDIKDQERKSQYYPRVDKARVFELGYVAERSGHTRGSTVDLTLIKDGQTVHDIVEKKRALLDGFSVTYLDDGSVDMGTSFDLFDIASHHENNLIPQEFKKMRTYLKDVMLKHGFKIIDEEWWHFTLVNEPYPASRGDSSYFNFPIE
jgi:D-alanyl-D-alanine dipeptidase